jgi:hypothetical protein
LPTFLGENGAVEKNGVSAAVGRREAPRFWHWPSLSLGLFVSLAIVGPTFLVEQTWYVAPLIDRGDLLWLLPSFVMGIGFLVGGMIAGHRCHGLKGALIQGLVVAALTVVLAFAGDLVRRHRLGEGLPLTVLAYWIAAVVAALVVGGLGGVTGRHLALRAWKRRGRAKILAFTTEDEPGRVAG